MIKTSITIAALAVVACGAGAACAQAGQESFTVEFRYDAEKSPEANYSAFARKAARVCTTPGPRPLALKVQEQACIEDVMNKLVLDMARPDIAAVHRRETGRRLAGGQDMAAR